ncbi:zonular occludens toxin domain-containing protein [Pseudomonas sp. F1_0610]|uniref:zonular occludens toxin domain-containing protein n=1 Tax=Pseudomonas sp. F1_0610 TaxID=3114284 RepID=UPI0039C36BDE
MAIKIHHGPNGSYKTSGAIQDDAVPALKAGRVIVTNIRGFTLDRCYTVFPDLPDTAEIINLDLEDLEDLEKMRTWMHWVPQGAFIIFDETQLLFPKSWREKDLEQFEFKGGPEAAKEANRPFNWLDAWTRHRHFGWDIVLTTPNISYIRDDIRMTCEMAYRHSNLAVIGIKGRYKESQHDAQLNRPPADGTIIEYKKIKQETFKLYQSTATGQVRDTFAGKSLLRSPKLLLLLLVLAYLIYSFFTSEGGSLLSSESAPSSPSVEVGSTSVKEITSTRFENSKSSNSLGSIDGAFQQVSNLDINVDHPFKGHKIQIVGRLVMQGKGSLYSFAITPPESEGAFMLNSYQMLESGYVVKPAGDCVAKVIYQGVEQFVTCKGKDVNQPAPEKYVHVPEEEKETKLTVIPYQKGKFLW